MPAPPNSASSVGTNRRWNPRNCTKARRDRALLDSRDASVSEKASYRRTPQITMQAIEYPTVRDRAECGDRPLSPGFCLSLVYTRKLLARAFPPCRLQTKRPCDTTQAE